MNLFKAPHHPSTRRHLWQWLAIASIVVTIAGCGEEGGGAGDLLDEVFPDTSALQPLVGTYDLTGNWNGFPDDEALIVIREPMRDGTSEVVIFDFERDLGDCYLPVRPGTAEFDSAANSVFMDGIIQFQAAELSLSGTTLVITYFENPDDPNSPQLTYRAPSVGIVELDIGPLCR